MRQTPRLAVLPVDALGMSPEAGPDLLRVLLDSFARTLPGAAVDAGAACPPGCAADPDCARSVGRRLGVPQVMVVTIASLARTHQLQARLVSIDETIAERAVRATVLGGPEAVADSVRGLPLRFFPPPSRWYTRWWVWAGTTLVVAAVTATVLLSRDSGANPDVVVPLP